MMCSVGRLVGEDCHKCFYGPVSDEIKLISELNEEEQNLIKLRTNKSITTICKYHELKFLVKYNHIFGKSCSDPLQIHKKVITKGLKEIKIHYLSKEKNSPVHLIPGKALCSTCYNRLFVIKDGQSELMKTGDEIDDSFVPPSETMQVLDVACSSLGISPVSKIRKLATEKRPSAIQTKLEKVSDSFKRKLEASFENEVEIPDEPLANPKSKHLTEEYESLIQKLKEKCNVATKEEKIKIISLLPLEWSRKRVSLEFEVSERLVKLTRALTTVQGIMPELGKRQSAKRINEATVKKVVDFYCSEENARMLPGKKDCVSVRVDGVKVHKQKQLLLCNLNEFYVKFRESYPEIKIGRSKFCELRPKWCVIAGASGTHTVCVCSYHQNTKLMIDGAKLNVDYKDLLEMLSCDLSNPKCMLGDCTECPTEEFLLELLNQEEETEEIPDNVCYKQWVTTDRAQMITVIKPREEFFDSLVQNLTSLKKHHFISKEQSKFLKDKKENLTDTECIVLSDFSENFSFVVQDEIQSYHWVNRQATVHPFVYYYKDSAGEMKSRSLCIISDHLEHNTVTVHVFQKYLIEDVRTIAPSVAKLIYFSDGASSQYKNKKNFLNLCHHEKDFNGLLAEWHFFATSHGKNACDGVGGTTKREVTKKSLQMTTDNQILCPEEMFEFCDKNLRGIKYIYVKSEEVVKHGHELQERFEHCLRVPNTRSYHKYVPVDDKTVKCYQTSTSEDFTIVKVSKALSFELVENDIVACVYEGQWYTGIILEISIEHGDCKIHFYEPAGPRTSFKISKDDKTWVPTHKILKKLTPLELTTVTGRTHTITPKLCEEISQLLVEHQT